MARKIQRYGWIPDLPDQRDYVYAAGPTVLRALPPKKDLTRQCAPVYNQGQLGSCTANAIGAAHQFEQMKGCLASGYPFVFGFTVYESFECSAVAKTGRVPMPRAGEVALGGHAVMAVGYNDADQRFIVRNSWGSNWGKKPGEYKLRSREV